MNTGIYKGAKNEGRGREDFTCNKARIPHKEAMALNKDNKTSDFDKLETLPINGLIRNLHFRT
jgi:hypothetical protein